MSEDPNRYQNVAGASLLLLLAALAAAMMGGCQSDSSQRIEATRSAVERARQTSKAIGPRIEQIEAALVDAREDLASADGDRAAEIRTFVAKAEQTLQGLEARKASIDRSVANWQTKIDAVAKRGTLGIGDEIELAGAGLQSAAPAVPSPWNAIIALVGSLVAAGGGLWGAWERRRRGESDQALREVVRGVDAMLDGPGMDSTMRSLAKETMSRSQSGPTEVAVKRAKG